MLYCLSVWHCLPPERLNHDGLLKTEYPSVVHIHTVPALVPTVGHTANSVHTSMYRTWIFYLSKPNAPYIIAMKLVFVQ